MSSKASGGRSRRGWWIGGGLAVAALAAITASQAMSGKKPPAIAMETAEVDRGKIAARISASGTLTALVTVQVGSQVSGRIDSLKVDFNSPVKKGQVIATLDASFFVAALEQARASLALAKANRDQAVVQSEDAARQLARTEKLAADRFVAAADRDTAEANARAAKAKVAASEASIQAAEAALHQAEINLKYTTIISPIDGVVISRNVDVGQTVAASLAAPTLFTIAQDLTKMQVDTSVAEGDVGKVRSGMPVTFTVDAYPGKRFLGTVRQVRDAATTVQNVVTYDAVIDVDNSGRLLKPGMTASVQFIYAERDDVIRIPNAALRFRPDAATTRALTRSAAAEGGAPTAGAKSSTVAARPTRKKPGTVELAGDERLVWVQRQDQPTSVKVKIGVSDGSLTEMVDGDLKAGDRLITEAIVSGTSPTGAASGGMPRRMF
ncbi:MAG: efflux RND transporter periplasmic adaptor subunit [Myxococcota bacterium]